MGQHLLSGLVVASAWVLALVTARFHGPVVFAPFLAHILTGGPIPNRSAFARPVCRALVAGAVFRLNATSNPPARMVSVNSTPPP